MQTTQAAIAAAIAAALNPAAIQAAIATPPERTAPAAAVDLFGNPMPEKRAQTHRAPEFTDAQADYLRAAIASGSLARQTRAGFAPCTWQTELFPRAGQMDLFTDTPDAREWKPENTPPHDPAPDHNKDEDEREFQDMMKRVFPPAAMKRTEPENTPPEPPKTDGNKENNLAGKVIVSHFHYSMTFYDFYGVLKDTGKSLSLIELDKTSENCGFMQARVRPIPDPSSPFGYRIKAGAKPITRRPDESGYFRTKPSHYADRTNIYNPAQTYTEDYAD